MSTKGIYKITNKNDGKVYIGQSLDCERRLKEHKQKRTLTIDDWINFLGADNFTYEIIEECDNLDEREEYYIEYYNSKKNGYNIQNGGGNNSVGEGNGRAKLTKQDVINIRTAYNNKASSKTEYQKYSDRVSLAQFQAVWQGRSWSNIMPEVYTDENKEFYRSGRAKEAACFTVEEILKYRHFYVDHTIKETYSFMKTEKGNSVTIKESTFRKIICGDVRKNSIYLTVPVYKKALKQWIQL